MPKDEADPRNRVFTVPEGPLADLIASLLAHPAASGKVYPFMHNNMTEFVPGETSVFYSGPYWGAEEVHAAAGALVYGQWLSAGEAVRKFEIEFGRKLGQKHALMVNSGSSANLVLLAAAKRHFGWADGDEVIVSVVGFPTTTAPVLQANLKPIFVDIEMESLNFDLDLVEKAVTGRTRALLVSPVLGNAPDFDRIQEICKRHDLVLLLDDCDSLGSKWDGKLLNQYAFASSNSFYSSHHLCTGEGGMVVSDNAAYMKIARSIAWWGRDCTCVGKANLLACGSCGNRFDKWLPDHDEVIDHRYVFTEIGYNLKPLDLQGAIGSLQLTRFDEIHERRRNSYTRISRILRTNLDVTVPDALPKAETSWFGVPLVCRDKAQKQALVKHFEASKIQTRNYFAGNLLLQPGYRHLGDHKDYPNADKVLDLVFFIGAAPHFTESVFQFIENVTKAFGG